MTRFKARLWLVRHAAPLVAPGTCYGALDVPADAAATQTAALRLAAALPRAARVFHSPLQRCEQLAKVLQRLRPDLASKRDARLRELDFGAWEGQPWSAIAKSAIDAWTAAFATHAPGGGESLALMLERVASALQTARDRPAQPAQPAQLAQTAAQDACNSTDATAAAGVNKLTDDTDVADVTDVVWITHAGVARCVHWLLAHDTGTLPLSEEWPLAAPGWGGWEVRDLH